MTSFHTATMISDKYNRRYSSHTYDFETLAENPEVAREIADFLHLHYLTDETIEEVEMSVTSAQLFTVLRDPQAADSPIIGTRAVKTLTTIPGSATDNTRASKVGEVGHFLVHPDYRASNLALTLTTATDEAARSLLGMDAYYTVTFVKNFKSINAQFKTYDPQANAVVGFLHPTQADANSEWTVVLASSLSPDHDGSSNTRGWVSAVREGARLEWTTDAMGGMSLSWADQIPQARVAAAVQVAGVEFGKVPQKAAAWLEKYVFALQKFPRIQADNHDIKDDNHNIKDDNHNIKDDNHNIKDNNHNIKDNNHNIKDDNHNIMNGNHNIKDDNHNIKDNNHDIKDDNHNIKDGNHNIKDDNHNIKDGNHNIKDNNHNIKDDNHSIMNGNHS